MGKRMLRFLSAAISSAIALCVLAVPSQAAVVGPFSMLLINALLVSNKVPSVSVAQIRYGRIVSAAAYGQQSPGVAATIKTLYNIASLTKPLSAEAFLRLSSQGRIGLDDRMADYWLDPDIATDPRAHLLTPRLSLSHRTGFPNWRSRTSGLAFARDPGQYGYSGEGFSYLARYVANKTGMELEPLVQARVFGPAGMADTAMTGRSWFAGRIATPTDANGNALEPVIAKTANPADLTYTTAADYARFLLQVMDDKGLTPNIAAQRRTIQTDMKAQTCSKLATSVCPDEIGFGLGWQIIVIGKQRFFLHTGSDDGVATFAYVSPTNHTGLVILTNGAKGGQLYAPLVKATGQDPALARLLEAMSQ
jgi:CubicO group peptidase (beta-lactamase class C family)